jgi:tetratricopeptide (TPR) repeat protein
MKPAWFTVPIALLGICASAAVIYRLQPPQTPLPPLPKPAELTTDPPSVKEIPEAYKQLMADGENALKGKRFQEAVNAFQQAEKAWPEGKEAPVKRDEAQTALALEKEKNKRVRDGLERGREALARREMHKCKKEAEAVLKEADNNPEARELVQSAEDALRQFKPLFASGEKAFQDKDIPTAVKQLELAAALVSDDDKANALLKDARLKLPPEAYAKHMADGENALKGKRFQEAVTAFEKAEKAWPEGKDAPVKRAEAKTGLDREERVRARLERGREALARKEMHKGKKEVEAVLEEDGDNTEAKKLVQVAKDALEKFKPLFASGEKAFQGNEFPTAVKQLELATALVSDDDKANALLKDARLKVSKGKLEGSVLLLVLHTTGSPLGKGELDEALKKVAQEHAKKLLGGQVYMLDRGGHRPWAPGAAKENALDGGKQTEVFTAATKAVEAFSKEAENKTFRVVLFVEVDGNPGANAPRPVLPANHKVQVCYLNKDSDEESPALKAWFPDETQRLKEVRFFSDVIDEMLGK